METFKLLEYFMKIKSIWRFYQPGQVWKGLLLLYQKNIMEAMCSQKHKYHSIVCFFLIVKCRTIRPKFVHFTMLAMPDKELQQFVVAAKNVSNMLLQYFTDVGRVGLIMEGTGVDHAHIKLVPMHGTGHMKQGVWKQYLSGRSDYFTKYEGYIISTDGPKADIEDLKKLAENLREVKL